MLGLALSPRGPLRARHPAPSEPTSRLGWGRWVGREGITGGPPPPLLRPGAGGCCSSPALLEGPCGVV